LVEIRERQRALAKTELDRRRAPDGFQSTGQGTDVLRLLSGGSAQAGADADRHPAREVSRGPHDTAAGFACRDGSGSFKVTSSPSHFATTAVASELPITLVAERPMSRNWSMPIMSSSPASGMLKLDRVAAMTTSEARGTPAMPLLVSISSSNMVTCCVTESWML